MTTQISHRFENTTKINIDMETTILKRDVSQKLCFSLLPTDTTCFAANWSRSSFRALSLRSPIYYNELKEHLREMLIEFNYD